MRRILWVPSEGNLEGTNTRSRLFVSGPVMISQRSTIMITIVDHSIL